MGTSLGGPASVANCLLKWRFRKGWHEVKTVAFH